MDINTVSRQTLLFHNASWCAASFPSRLSLEIHHQRLGFSIENCEPSNTGFLRWTLAFCHERCWDCYKICGKNKYHKIQQCIIIFQLEIATTWVYLGQQQTQVGALPKSTTEPENPHVHSFSQLKSSGHGSRLRTSTPKLDGHSKMIQTA